MNKSRVRNTLVNTFSGLAMKFVSLIANFAVKTVFIYYLGVEYTGIQTVFTDILTVLSFAELGIGSAITYALYKPLADKDYEQMSRLMHLYKTAYRIIAIVVFVAGVALIPFLDKIISGVPSVNEDLATIYLFYIINTSVSYLLIYKSTLFTANQQAYIISYISIAITIIRTVVQLVVIICFRDFLLYLILTIIFTFLQNIIISVKADKQFKELKKHKGLRLSKKDSTTIFKNIKALSLYKISGTVLNGTDSVIISAVLGTRMVGFVANYTMIINEIYTLSIQFLNSVTASIGNLVASEEREQQYELFRKLNFVCEWFFCLCTVCLMTLLDEFIGQVWLDKSFVLSFWTSLFLCIDFFLKGNTTIVGSFRNANGLFVQGQYRPVIMVILNIGISIIAVNEIGLPGVFLGTVVSRAVTQMWYDPFVLYKYAFKRSAKGYFCEYAAWLIICVLSFIISRWINRAIFISIPLLSFVIHALVCLVVVCTLCALIFFKNKNFHSSLLYIRSFIKK